MAKRDGCPICGRPASTGQKPFCSPRCRDRDLLNWLGDAYRVPAEPVSPEPSDGLDSDGEPSL